MQIQLKQAEIVTALKQYIAAQGINLSGKGVSISFTAGRKEAGIVAELIIEDGEIPGYTDGDDAAQPAAVPLTIVSSFTPDKKTDRVATLDVEIVEPSVTGSEAIVEPPDTPKTTSLFN